MCTDCKNTDHDFLAEIDALGANDPLPPAQETKREQEREWYTCVKCGGSGRYHGPRNHDDDTCYACGGRGGHKLHPDVRKQRNAKRKATLRENQEATRAAVAEEHAELLDKLNNIASWNDFARDLVAQWRSGRRWSDKQIAAAQRTVDKVEANRKAKAEAQAKAAVEVDLTLIADMFATARSNGLKRTTYRAEGLVISPAPAHGVNAGALYVKTDAGTYQGKVMNNLFIPIAYGVDATTGPALSTIAANPQEAAVAWGRKTGTCSCCGRELTDPVSIEAGIGPICAAKWFS